MLRDWVRKYSKLLLTFLSPFSLFHKRGTLGNISHEERYSHYYLTSPEAARTRTMGAVSRNDEEDFVWIIPWYSHHHWAAPSVVGYYSFFSFFHNVITSSEALISLKQILSLALS